MKAGWQASCQFHRFAELAELAERAVRPSHRPWATGTWTVDIPSGLLGRDSSWTRKISHTKSRSLIILAPFNSAHLRHRGIMHSRPHAVDSSPHVEVATEVLVRFRREACRTHSRPVWPLTACLNLSWAFGRTQPRVTALQCYTR